MLTAVTGINWGDEGKGRVIDLLAENADIVARYQGGNNAGHTVVTEKGKFILNLLPSGILHPEVTCVLGTGMVVDLDHLAGEMAAIEERGVEISPKNLKLSDKATISMPWHKVQDGLEEDLVESSKNALSLRASSLGWPRMARPLVPLGGALPTRTATNTAKRPCVWATCSTWTRSAPRTACT